MKRSFTLIELLVVIVTIILVTTSSHVVSASEGDPLVAQNYQFTSKWGTAGFGPGQFTDLICITTDAAGLIYTAEDEGHRICKFTAEGKLLQVIGGEKEAPMLFGQIDGLAVDKDGNIYVGDPKCQVPISLDKVVQTVLLLSMLIFLIYCSRNCFGDILRLV